MSEPSLLGLEHSALASLLALFAFFSSSGKPSVLIRGKTGDKDLRMSSSHSTTSFRGDGTSIAKKEDLGFGEARPFPYFKVKVNS